MDNSTINGQEPTPPEPQGSGAATPTPQPRKRGRPFGSTNKPQPSLTETPVGANGADPAAAPGAAPQKRRRRAAQVDADQLAKQLKGIHMILAKITNDPVMELTDVEAVMLAGSISAVSREYDLALDGKTGALIQLAATAAIVYGPRIMHIQAKKRRAPQTIDGTIDSNAGQTSASESTPAVN